MLHSPCLQWVQNLPPVSAESVSCDRRIHIDIYSILIYTFRTNMKNMTLRNVYLIDKTYKRSVSKMSMPKGKHIFGTVKVGERGQIVIPKEARELFDINLEIPCSF